MNNRIEHNFIQGSPEWAAHRATPNQFNGSEIVVILGISPHTTRSELIRLKSAGCVKEYSEWMRKNVLNKGHENEALARPIAEGIVGDDLPPKCFTNIIDGVLFSSSLDGRTFDGGTIWEGKSLNKDLAEAMDNNELPAMYHPQCETGLMTSGAARCLFTASTDGDATTTRHTWYVSSPELRRNIIAACKQFTIDCDNYVHVEVLERPKAEISINLPTIFVTAHGGITASNMGEFGIALKEKLTEVRAIVLATDQDFSNAKSAAKMFREKAKEIALSEQGMLAQTTTIGEASAMMKSWIKDLNATALQLEKDVEREDQNKKRLMISDAASLFTTHLAALEHETRPIRIGVVTPDWISAIKGKSKYQSMQDALDTMLANAKIAADQLASECRKKLEWCKENAAGRNILFPDLQQIIVKPFDDFILLIKSRMDEADKAEAVRISIERDKMQAKADAEAKAKADKIVEDAARAEKAREDARVAVEAKAKNDADKAAAEADMAAKKPIEVNAHYAPVASQEELEAAHDGVMVGLAPPPERMITATDVVETVMDGLKVSHAEARRLIMSCSNSIAAGLV